jgi:hypothetical protein
VVTNPFDNPCPYPGNSSLDYLVPRSADHKCASGVDWRKQRIAVLEAMLEVGQGLAELLDKPVEFAFLFCLRKVRFNQYP